MEENMLEASLSIKLGDFVVEGVRVGLGNVKGTVGNGCNAFVLWSL